MRPGIGALLTLAACACAAGGRTAPPSTVIPPAAELETKTGRIQALPIPAELLRDAEYEIWNPRTKISIELQLVGASGCRTPGDFSLADLPDSMMDAMFPPSEPEAPEDPSGSASDDELLEEMTGERDRPRKREPETTDAPLERREVRLVDLPGELVSTRTHLDSKRILTRFHAVARGPERNMEGGPRLTCVNVHSASYDADSGDTFRAIIASIGPNPPTAPPEGFTRFPFGPTHIDLPDGLELRRVVFRGFTGYFYARIASERSRDQDADIRFEALRVYKQQEITFVESNVTEALLGGSLITSRARSTRLELRQATLQRVGHPFVSITTMVVGQPPRPNGEPLDPQHFRALVEAVVPLLGDHPGD